jgi:hypothetical protein
VIRKFLRSLAAVAVACAATSSFAHDPVILIPGLTAQPSAMDTMRTNFINAGWPAGIVHTWTDSNNMTGDLAQAGVELGNKINSVLAQTGAQKVVLVTWSASTLAGRSYLKNVAGAQGKVSLYFSMAGPHHGTTTASGCPQYTACQQFAPNSSFLAALNSGTEVPGSPTVKYMTLRSTCDVNVNPTDSAVLSGADNQMAPTCISHFDFPRNAQVFNLIKNTIIASEEPSEPPPNAPPAPTGAAAGVPTSNSIPVSWNGVTGVAGYNVYRSSAAAGPWTKSNGTLLTGTTHTVSGLASGTTYYLTVRSQDSAGIESANSNVVSATTTGSSACYYASNYAHTVAGRATTSGGYTYAKGSNQAMGLWVTGVYTRLRQTGPSYYVIDATCQ